MLDPFFGNRRWIGVELSDQGYEYHSANTHNDSGNWVGGGHGGHVC